MAKKKSDVKLIVSGTRCADGCCLQIEIRTGNKTPLTLDAAQLGLESIHEAIGENGLPPMEGQNEIH